MKVIRDWLVLDVLDLRKGIATLMEMAATLNRNRDDVWEKATARDLWGKKIEFRHPQRRNPRARQQTIGGDNRASAMPQLRRHRICVRESHQQTVERAAGLRLRCGRHAVPDL
jgi:hypothetical protein